MLPDLSELVSAWLCATGATTGNSGEGGARGRREARLLANGMPQADRET